MIFTINYADYLNENKFYTFICPAVERRSHTHNYLELAYVLKGSAMHLRQVLEILLDNAQKYSAPGTVDICLQRHGRNQCLLSVSNPGNPIPQEDLEAIFQRFYRVDSARTHSGSFGLGLAIAQRIAQEHGGQIWAQSNKTGNRFSVLLPCYPAV